MDVQFILEAYACVCCINTIHIASVLINDSSLHQLTKYRQLHHKKGKELKGRKRWRKKETEEQERREGRKEEEGNEMSREATVPEELPQLEGRDSVDRLVLRETVSPGQGQPGSLHGAGGAEGVAAAAELSNGGGGEAGGEVSGVGGEGATRNVVASFSFRIRMRRRRLC